MRLRWWRSIRWRLALGSMLVVLLAICILTTATLIAVARVYSADQGTRLVGIATTRAGQISEHIAQGEGLFRASAAVLPDATAQSSSNEEVLFIVYDRRGNLIYPSPFRTGPPTAVTRFLLKLVDPAVQQRDFANLNLAIRKGLRGTQTAGAFGKGTLVPEPFLVQPIKNPLLRGPAVSGVLVVTAQSAADNSIAPFVASVSQVIILAALIVTFLAALAAIIFSRTITRPLARLTTAAQKLAAGDYSVQIPTNSQGELGELAHTFNDMAAQLKRDVEELRQQERWRRELLMSVTHDLATPLTAIAGLGESLLDGVNQSREDYEATGRVIVRETLRLRRLVRDLHIMAKVEAGALQPQRKTVRLAALVDEVLAVLTPEFERADVEPCNAIPYDLPPIEADPDMLTRVFSNLCDNALRHTPHGGTVTIEADQHPTELLVSVTDTGEGIPPEALPRIFERFFRADSSCQSSTGGSGLGLAIVRAIIEAHGGRVWAEKVSGAGARIAFTVPIHVAEPATIREAKTATLPLT
ncbi:MAG TPA: ATP-binding protein [Ktedonobacteraceae bacterium]|nr:ATP-binding protein [Ktedonobacteraceae bacterium]